MFAQAHTVNEWLVFGPLLAFVLGCAYLGLAAFLFAIPLVWPAFGGDAAAAIGLGAFTANVTLLFTFCGVILPWFIC